MTWIYGCIDRGATRLATSHRVLRNQTVSPVVARASLPYLKRTATRPKTGGMFALRARVTSVPVVSVPKSTRKRSALTKRGVSQVVKATQVSSDSEPIAESTLPRRGVLAVALGVCVGATASCPGPALAQANSNSLFAIAENEETKSFEFKTYRLAAPSVYEEVNIPLKDPATGVESPTVLLLRDTRVGQAGNTISVSKQQIPEGGIKSVADIGSASETAQRLVDAESARSTGTFGRAFGGKGGVGALRSSSQRVDTSNNLYYTAEYTKSVLGVSRVVLSVLVVANGTLYTCTAEEDENRFDNEMAAGLRAAAESFTVVSEPVAVAVAVGKKVAKKGRK